MVKSGSKAEKSDNPKVRGGQRAFSDNPVGSRIIEALDGRTRKWLASSSGLSESTVSDYIANGIAKAEAAVDIARSLGVTVDWLLTGTGARGTSLQDDLRRWTRAAGENERTEELADELGLMKLPEIDISVGMGAGYSDEAVIETVDRWLPAEWVRRFTDAPVSRLAVIRPKGDSMYPTINDGDIVFIDRSQQRIDEQDLIWTLVYGGLRTIRRVRAMPDGSYRLLADNDAVPEQTAHDDEMFIIGRVAGVIRRL